MAESHFLSALKQRRGEYLEQLNAIRAKMTGLEADESEALAMLDHVDALLRVEAPDLDLDGIGPRRKRVPHPRSGVAGADGGRGTFSSAVLTTLRRRGAPMSAREVFEALQTTYADRDQGKLLRDVSVYLSNKKKAGLLRAVAYDGRSVRYMVAA
jgi:hypothetical protein